MLFSSFDAESGYRFAVLLVCSTTEERPVAQQEQEKTRSWLRFLTSHHPHASRVKTIILGISLRGKFKAKVLVTLCVVF